ncbi:hypothetical protein DFP86_11424 [Paludibacterium purpuratum]|uniref:Uncharacterized protein n=1 Tax=Paludibacterium purpuratum TaxID=1144873 RepID=A0A4R7AYT1_9NEIS|nr:hypothetical protein DFP86_11424 [Paludibacterium purpuratum]
MNRQRQRDSRSIVHTHTTKWHLLREVTEWTGLRDDGPESTPLKRAGF